MYQYVIESNLNLQINYFLWIIIQIRTFPGLEKSANSNSKYRVYFIIFFNPDFKPNVITALFVCIQQTVIGMTSVLSKMKTIMNRQNICTCCCYSISQVPSYIFFALVPKRLWSCWLQETVCMYVCVFKTLKFHFLPFVKINQIRFSFAKKNLQAGNNGI